MVQDQIGGESWPGSLSDSRKRMAPNPVAQAAGKDGPSGRLLEPHREVRPRGMIVAACCCKVVHRQNPAYRLIRYKVFCFHCILLDLASDCAQNVPAIFSKPSPFSISRLLRSRSSFTNGA